MSEGDRRLYLRVRDHDDGRKFNEYSVDIGRPVDTDTDHGDDLRTDGGLDNRASVTLAGKVALWMSLALLLGSAVAATQVML